MPEHPGIPQPHRESISKHVWIKLTGPAAGCLSEAFCQSVAGLQENVSAKVVTPREAQRDDVTVPPTMIVMEGKAAGAQKYIKVEKLYRIVLLGNTEAGKSSLANIIFGENVFQVNNTECQTESKSLHGRRITLINTPDFSGPGRSEELKPEILRCITECTPGPHAFVIVLKVEKSTEQQQQAVIEKISQYFSEEIFKYAAVVFTQDGPDSDEMKIKQFIDQNKYLRDLVKKCKSRYHIINKYNGQGGSSQFKVVDLLNTVDRLVNENKGVCYTSKMLPQADTHYKANSSVSKNEMIKLAGAAAESMAKAFSGSAVVVLTPGTTNRAEEPWMNATEKDGTETDEKEENGDGKATSETNNNGQKEMTNEEEEGGGGRKNQQTKVTKEDNREITKGEEERKSEGEIANETKEAQEGKTTGQSNELEQDEGPNETQEDREEEAGETVQEETQEKIEGKVEDKPQKTVQEHATEKEPLGGGASAGGGAAAGGGVAAGVLLTAASGIAGGVLSAAASGIGGGALSAGASGIGGGALSAAVESVAAATGAGASAGTAGMGGAAEAVKAAGAGANAGTAGAGGAAEAVEAAGANAGTAGAGGAAEAVEAAGAGTNAGTAGSGSAAEAVEAAGAGANAGTAGGGGAAEAVEAAGAGANAGTAGARGAAAAAGYVAAAAVATGGAVGIAWLIQKIRNVIELIKQHVGLVLLVLVFYSLLLSWFFLKAPFAGTLLLSFLFLLLVIILVII